MWPIVAFRSAKERRFAERTATIRKSLIFCSPAGKLRQLRCPIDETPLGVFRLTKPIESHEIADLLDQFGASMAFYASQWTAAPEDCVQEAFVALAGQAKLPESPVSWLFRVVRNRALNEYRATRRRSKRELKAAKPDLCRSDPAEKSEFDEERNRMLDMLGRLNPRDRELIVLRIWSELSWSEISELTGTSTSSAQRNYVAALEKLKKKLESKCMTKRN